jgi:hypothetical protein
VAALAFGFAGLVVTIGSIFGIVAVARAIGRTSDTGLKVVGAIGIAALCGFALIGLLTTGCAAIIGTS